MIPNLTSIITILIVATPVLILILFLPAIIELKRPKDRGPRMIMAEIPAVTLSSIHAIAITNMEYEQKFDSSLTQPMAKIIAVLPNLEI
jgi:hypothetical protein